LLQVFPVLILAAVIEGRLVHKKIRLLRWYRWLVIVELALGIFGMAFCYQGFGDGLEWAPAVIVDACFYMLAIGLALQLTMILATQEVEDEEGQTPEGLAREREDAAVLRALAAPPRTTRRWRWRWRRKASSTSR